MAAERVRVALGVRAYDVVVTGALDGLGAAVVEALPGTSRVVLATDEHVDVLWGEVADASLRSAGLRVERLVVPAGERHKHRDTWWRLVDGLLEVGVDRRTPVVALGGGVLGDLAGFAAASTLRGLPFVQVPTTLLAMVDSAVGGKTGFNHPRGKNLVGAFHQPSLVWAALDTLQTLDRDVLRAGLGEVVKTALLGDAALLEALEVHAEDLAAGRPDVLAPVVARCVALKAEVVAEDERESGRRAVLNAGHTVGHAIEAVAGFGAVEHGAAVGIGLVAELRWSVGAGLTQDTALPDRVARLLARLGLPSEVPPQLSRDALIEAVGVDKKVHEAMLTVPVVVRPGRCDLTNLPMHRAQELFPR